MTFVAGQTGQIAFLNTTDTQLNGAWTAFTPALTQGVAITLTSNSSRWKAVGKQIFVHYGFATSSAGTATAGISLSVPTTAFSISALTGSGTIFFQDSSVPLLYTMQPVGSTTALINFLNVPGGTFGNNAAVTIASGDVLYGTLVFEGA